MSEAMLLPTTMQPPVAAPTCKPGTVAHGVNLRVSTFRPPNLVRTSVAQERRPSRKPKAAAAEVVSVPEVVAAQEQKKKIAIFVEPSPFSHVSGRLKLHTILEYHRLQANQLQHMPATLCILGIPSCREHSLDCPN